MVMILENFALMNGDEAEVIRRGIIAVIEMGLFLYLLKTILLTHFNRY